MAFGNLVKVLEDIDINNAVLHRLCEVTVFVKCYKYS